MTLAQAALGNHATAIEHAREGVRLSPDAIFLKGLLGAVLGMAGQRDEALAVLDELRCLSGTTYVAPILRSWIHLHTGERDLAFEALEDAYAERSCALGFGVRFPIYDGIRDDPRFSSLMDRIGLH